MVKQASNRSRGNPGFFLAFGRRLTLDQKELIMSIEHQEHEYHPTVSEIDHKDQELVGPPLPPEGLQLELLL